MHEGPADQPPLVYWEPMETAAHDPKKRVLIWTGKYPDPIEIGRFAVETWTDSGRPALYWMPLPDRPYQAVLNALAQRRVLTKVIRNAQFRLAEVEAGFNVIDAIEDVQPTRSRSRVGTGT